MISDEGKATNQTCTRDSVKPTFCANSSLTKASEKFY